VERDDRLTTRSHLRGKQKLVRSERNRRSRGNRPRKCAPRQQMRRPGRCVPAHSLAHANGNSLSSNQRPCTWAVARNGKITRATSPSSRRCASAMISSDRISA